MVPLYGMLFAEQGFHVVLQSCRGTGGSGGRFDLWRNEAADGRATVSWLREQPWFNGVLGTVGPSYLGYTQWALALDPPPELKAMVMQVGLHDPYALFHTDGALRLENALLCGVGITYQHRGLAPFIGATLRLQRRFRRIVTARPLREAYVSALGSEVPWLDDVMTHADADDPYWAGASAGAAAERLSVPTCLITGWHDALVDQTFEQYGRLRRAAAGPPCSPAPGPTPPRFSRGGPRCSPRVSRGCARTCARTLPACAPPECASTSAARTRGGTSTHGRSHRRPRRGGPSRAGISPGRPPRTAHR